MPIQNVVATHTFSYHSHESGSVISRVFESYTITVLQLETEKTLININTW
jgi:hypothetical protein